MADLRLRRPGETVRAPRARWVVMGEVNLTSAAHLGGPDEGPEDLVVLTTDDGAPLLTGASLAGGLRSYLADRLGGYLSPESKTVARLFGTERGQAGTDGDQSPLVVFECPGRLPRQAGLERRQGVRVTRATRQAAEGALFDLQVIPPGTVFPVRVDLVVVEPAPGTHGNDEASLLAGTLVALSGLDAGGITLGARGARGYGALRSSAWRARRYSLETREGWIQWLESDHEHPLDNVDACVSPRAAVEAELVRRPVAGITAGHLDGLPDSRHRVEIKLEVRLRGTIMVRVPSDTSDGPDASHVCSGGKLVLPGTAVAGVLRAAAAPILADVHPTHAQQWLNVVFGTEPDPAAPRPARASLWASHLHVGEIVLEGDEAGARPVTVTRVRLDRLTGGSDSSALFTELVAEGGRFELQLQLRAPGPGETGLLLLLVKELADGWVPLGGEVAVGRGELVVERVQVRTTQLGDDFVELGCWRGSRGGEKAVGWADHEIEVFRKSPEPPERPTDVGARARPDQEQREETEVVA